MTRVQPGLSVSPLDVYLGSWLWELSSAFIVGHLAESLTSAKWMWDVPSTQIVTTQH